MLTSRLEQLVSPQNLANLSMLLYTIIYFPQIIKNYRIKSGSGLSDYFLLAYFHTYMALFFYIFILNLNIAYKIACPIQGFAVLILILQRLYYDKAQAKTYSLLYLVNFLAYIVFIPFVELNPIFIAHFFGWTSLILTFFNQVPQVLKVFNAKSVEGFSYMFVLIMGLAAASELYAALVLQLPLQTIFSAVLGLVYFITYSFLFAVYSSNYS